MLTTQMYGVSLPTETHVHPVNYFVQPIVPPTQYI